MCGGVWVASEGSQPDCRTSSSQGLKGENADIRTDVLLLKLLCPFRTDGTGPCNSQPIDSMSLEAVDGLLVLGSHISQGVEKFKNYYTRSVQIPKTKKIAAGHRAKSGLLR